MKSRMAKVLHRAGGKPLVRHAIDAALKLRRRRAVFVVVGYQAAEVSAAVEAAGVQVDSSDRTIGHGARRDVRRGEVCGPRRAADRVRGRLPADSRGHAGAAGGNAACQRCRGSRDHDRGGRSDGIRADCPWCRMATCWGLSSTRRRPRNNWRSARSIRGFYASMPIRCGGISTIFGRIIRRANTI